MRLKPWPLTLLLIAMLPLFCPGGAFTADRLATILESGNLRVCIWPDSYGISFRPPKTNQLTGVDVDMARQLAHDLGSAARSVLYTAPLPILLKI